MAGPIYLHNTNLEIGEISCLTKQKVPMPN